MSLFKVSFWISCKHSGLRLLCLLCVLAGCAGLGYAVFSAVPSLTSAKASVAVINLDSNPLSRMALHSFASMKSLKSMLNIRFIEPEEKDMQEFTAVMTIPEGFLDSVLNGENRSPLVEVNISSPLEAMWVRQLADAGSAYLTSAQLGVYTVQEEVAYGAEMDPAAYGALLDGINIVFMRAFLNRLELVSEQTLSVSGALPLPKYYLAALVSVLFFSYGFLFQPAVRNLRGFSRGLPARPSALPAAAFLHVLALSLACALLVSLPAAGGISGLDATMLAAIILFALLTGSFALLLSLLFEGRASCAAACILLACGMGLCGGGFLPLPLMPPVFAALAPFMPAWQGLRLYGVLLGAPLEWGALWQPLLLAAAMLSGAALLWNQRGTR